MTARFITAVLLGIALMSPGPVGAASLGRLGTNLVYSAEPGEANNLLALTGTGKLLLDDNGATVATRAGCGATSAGRAECDLDGIDLVNSRDGLRDWVDCGSGLDDVLADRVDDIEVNCDHALRVPLADRRAEIRVVAFLESDSRLLGLEHGTLIALALAAGIGAWLVRRGLNTRPEEDATR